MIHIHWLIVALFGITLSACFFGAWQWRRAADIWKAAAKRWEQNALEWKEIAERFRQ